MTEPSLPIQPLLPSKGRIILTSLLDFAVDLLLPTAIYALLGPTGLSPVIRLTIGGFFVAAKAAAGRIATPADTATPADSAVNPSSSVARTLTIGLLLATVCTAVTVATHLKGASDSLAILAGTSVFVVAQGIALARTWRRLDGFALLVLVELIATIILTSISNDARFVLMRPSFYTTIAGIYVLTTVWTARPFMMQVTKPIAAAGDPVRAEAFERAGRESLPFRRAEQAMTLGLALVLLGEAVLRIVMVLSHPGSNLMATSLWSQLPSIALFVVYFAVVKLVFVPRASREVDSLMPK